MFMIRDIVKPLYKPPDTDYVSIVLYFQHIYKFQYENQINFNVIELKFFCSVKNHVNFNFEYFLVYLNLK